MNVQLACHYGYWEFPINGEMLCVSGATPGHEFSGKIGSGSPNTGKG
jgi:hypothetical protein